MYLKKIAALILFISIVSCKQNTEAVQEKQNTPQELYTEQSVSTTPILEDKPIKNSKFTNDFTQKASALLSKNKFVPFDVLQGQKLKNIEENSNIIVSSNTPTKMNGNQIYFYLKERTLAIGRAYDAPYGGIALSMASGYVIHEDGVIVTNYHVIEVMKNMKSKALFVSDAASNVYPITGILSSSQTNDLAILKIDTKGEKIKSIPFAAEELVGENIYMMGHPFNNYFYMENGIIANKYISDRDDGVKIAITAEFGQGASGGPVVNENGQLVGMVSATMMEYVNGSREHGALQFIVKEVVPVSVISDYIKRD
jgi:S1-C subfamily serine protease